MSLSEKLNTVSNNMNSLRDSSDEASQAFTSLANVPSDELEKRVEYLTAFNDQIERMVSLSNDESTQAFITLLTESMVESVNQIDAAYASIEDKVKAASDIVNSFVRQYQDFLEQLDQAKRLSGD